MERKLIDMRCPIQVGVNSDPLQPCEKVHKVTLNVLGLLKKWQYPAVITTKFPGQLTESEYLRTLDGLPLIVQVSISSGDADLLHRLEPGAPSLSQRLDAMKTLSDAGATVQLRLCPYAEDISGDAKRLFELAHDAGVRVVQCNPLKIYHNGHGADRLNAALGYDYLASTSLRYENLGVFSSISLEEQRSQVTQLEGLCRELSMDLLSCDDLTRHRGWKTCCGTDGIKGFEGVAGWSYFTNGWRITQHTTFEEFLRGHNCPWHAEFEREWNAGKLERALPELIFNSQDKTYTRVW